MPKPILSLFIAIIILSSCNKNPVDVTVPGSIVTYVITDTMLLSETIITSFPDLYNDYNNKTYSRETSKVKSYYNVEGADISIMFEDTSDLNLGTALSIKIPNKSLQNISGHYSAPVHDIFYKWQQKTSPTSSVFSGYNTRADSCNIQIEYDDKTKTISGTIAKLKYPIGFYIPFYMPGSTVTPRAGDAVFLTSGGSSRQHTITFQHIKAY